MTSSTTTTTTITTATTTTTPTLETGRDAVLNRRLDSMSLEGKARSKICSFPHVSNHLNIPFL